MGMKAVAERHVRLFKNGKNQALRIPREFELPGNEAVIHKEGDRLIIEPTKKKSLLNLLSTWQPSDEGLPDVDQGLLPLDDVDL
jgi:antitoxin VapB